MKIPFLLALTLSLTLTKSYSCDCKGKSLAEYQTALFNESKMVFIADVISSNKEAGTYKLKIVELFKGQLGDSIISGEDRTSCSGFAENGRWIIYVESIDKGLIDFNVCGISRSFDRPEWIMVSDYSFPGPLRDRKDPEQSTQEMIDFYKVLAKNKERALFDLEFEISMLRRRKQ